jgi:hypothetical protein
MRKTRVYVAGPYTSHPTLGTRNAILVGQRLCDEGYLAFVPHQNLIWDLVAPNPPEFYLWWDQEWLKTCDALIRLAGYSPGSDGEVALAESISIPVFYTMHELMAAIPPESEDLHELL